MGRVKEYRIRRYNRLLSRFDTDDKGKWVTTEAGHKIHLSEKGVPDKGNLHVLAAANKKHADAIKAAAATWRNGSHNYAKFSAKVKKALDSLADGTEVKLGDRVYTKTTGKTGKAEFHKAGDSTSLNTTQMSTVVYTQAYTASAEVEIGFNLSKGDKKKITSGDKDSSEKKSPAAAVSVKPTVSPEKEKTVSGKKGASKTTTTTTVSTKASTSSGSTTKSSKTTSGSASTVETSVGKFSKKEMKTLDKLAEELVGWKFTTLPDDDQEYVYDEAMERGLL